MPEFYDVIVAAQWAGVPPWELAKQSDVWRHWILITKVATDQARAELQRRANDEAGA
jgi:hypothetical protein